MRHPIITSGTLHLPETGDSIKWEIGMAGKGFEFSASGNCEQGRCGGQCLDEILKRNPKSKIVQRIYKVWKRWHLNGMKAGVPVQEAAIKAWVKLLPKGKRYDYTKACEFLASIDLYEIDGYKYGHEWKHETLPESVIAEVVQWKAWSR